MEQLISFLLDLIVGNSHGVVMGIAAAAIGAGAAILGGVLSSQSAKKQREEQLRALRQQQEKNEAWYNRRYNEDATQRADAQLALRRTNDAIKQRTLAALGKKNVIGGTDASMATVQQQNAKAVGDALGDIVAQSETRKDNIEDQYRQRDASLDAQQSDVNSTYEATKRANIANAVTGTLKATASSDSDGGAATRGVDTNTEKLVNPADELTRTRSADDYAKDIEKYYSTRKDPWQQTKTDPWKERNWD